MEGDFASVVISCLHLFVVGVFAGYFGLFVEGRSYVGQIF